MIDNTDFEILTILRRNSTTPKAEIARRVGLTPTAVFERIRKLEDRGVITGYRAELDPVSFGAGLLAFVFVTSERHLEGPELGETLAGVPGVEEVHAIAGEDCFLLKMRAADPKQLYRVLKSHVGSLASVRGIRSTIVLETVTEAGEACLVPRDAADEAEDAALRPRNLLSLVEGKYGDRR